MFLVTSIAMLRERTTGTLERLMTLPLAKADLLAGYGLAFGLLAAAAGCRRLPRSGFAGLGLDAPHGAWLVGLLAIGNAVLGMALGLFVSAFARTEFQAVQFMPAIVLPQLLLCGLFVPREEMASRLHAVSWALPFTYAYDALDRATRAGPLGARRRGRRRGALPRHPGRPGPRGPHPAQAHSLGRPRRYGRAVAAGPERDTKCPSGRLRENPSAAPGDTSRTNSGRPQRSYWSASM